MPDFTAPDTVYLTIDGERFECRSANVSFERDKVTIYDVVGRGAPSGYRQIGPPRQIVEVEVFDIPPDRLLHDVDLSMRLQVGDRNYYSFHGTVVDARSSAGASGGLSTTLSILVSGEMVRVEGPPTGGSIAGSEYAAEGGDIGPADPHTLEEAALALIEAGRVASSTGVSLSEVIGAMERLSRLRQTPTVVELQERLRSAQDEAIEGVRSLVAEDGPAPEPPGPELPDGDEAPISYARFVGILKR